MELRRRAGWCGPCGHWPAGRPGRPRFIDGTAALNGIPDDWLDRLMDGDTQVSEGAATPAQLKMARLQRAFADLQWGELDPPQAQVAVMFQWGHLGALAAIGAGGFGEVFRAHDSMLQREVALKLRRAGNQIAPAAGRAFIEEARRLAQVRHPNVLAVHGAGVHDGRAGIWTDLIVGETLAARIARTGALAADDLLELLSALSGALAAVHAKDIVHGDLTPMNIMCEAVTGRYVLMDFGGGASLDERGETRLGAGSLHFMAPEQMSTDRLGTAADLYSLGATLLFAATKRTPDDPAATRRLDDRGDLAKPFRQLLRSMLDPIAAMRPSALAVAEQCRALRAEPERARRRRLRRAVMVLLSIALLAMLLGLVFTTRAQTRALHAAERANAALGFVADWFKVADPNLNNGRQLTAHAMFEDGARRLQTELADQSDVRGRMEQIIGEGFLGLGESGDALPHLEQAIGLLRTDPATDPLVLASALERGAFAAESASRMQQALAWLGEADALASADTAQTVDIRVKILSDRWQIERGAGRWLVALELAQRSLALSQRFDAGALSERSARALVRIGNSLKDVGRQPDALQALERARDWYAAAYGPDDMRTVNTDEAVGWVLTDLGRLDEAEQKLDAAAVQVRAYVGENTRRYANNLYDRAQLYYARGDLPRARDAFVEVARIHAETYAPNSVAQGWSYYQAAGIEWRLNHHAKALAMMLKVDRLWDGPMPESSPIRAELWGDIGELHFILGHTDEASAEVDRAIAVLRGQVDAHESALADVLAVKAGIAQARGNQDDARALLAEAVVVAQREKLPSAENRSAIADYQHRLVELNRLPPDRQTLIDPAL